jgi:hypothetical protein
MPTIQTLRPGYLISLKTSVRGNVKYDKRDLGKKITEDGSEIVEWETTRAIADPIEFKRAGEARSKARSILASVCVNSPSFGLLCPKGRKDQLDLAISDARRVVDAFNAEAFLTRVSVFIMIGEIAENDLEAVKSINSEVSDLLARIDAGLRNLDVKAIRDAANKAKQIGQMLSPEAAERIQVAIDAARTSARRIAKAGEQAAVEVDLQAIAKVTASRTAFLDLDEAKEVAAPQHEGRSLDLAPEVEVAQPKATARAIEL